MMDFSGRNINEEIMDLKQINDTPPWDWPEDTDKIFLEVLRNDRSDPSDRLVAADLAGDLVVVNNELVEALLSILNNSDMSEDLRQTAATSLGPVLEHADMEGFDDPDDVPITEDLFLSLKASLKKGYMDADVPKNVRRRILEASVLAPEDWHRDAVRAAYASNDEDWKLTAVFAMRWVQGFDHEILEALESEDPHLHYQAVCAAGNWEIDAAWPHISDLITSGTTDKSLLLAAIDASVEIRPEEAGMILVDLTNSDDEDIVEAAYEAMAMAESIVESEDLDDDTIDRIF
jgi:hypothetical protein